MRILLLTTSFPLWPGSSSGVFVERLAQRLGQHCHLQVLSPAAQESLILADDKAYRLSTFSYAPPKWRILAHAGGGIPAALSAHPWVWLLVPLFIVSMAIACFWQARRADLIFANWSICGVVAGVVGHVWGVPVVTTLRGGDANRVDSSFAHRLLIRLCLRLGARVIAVSDDIAQRMKNLFPTMAGKIVMIPNGVDPVPACIESGVDVESGVVRLLIVGSLVAGKSVQTALEALAHLPAGFSLTVVGDGPERDALSTLAAKLGIGERVRFVGRVPPEQVPQWLTKSDVLVMASRSEGRPNAVLEAMAAGLPVVGTDIPGIRELVTPDANGMLFPLGDSEALVACLLPLQDEILRRRLGEASRRSIAERGLTWENTADRYMRVFEQLVDEGTS